MLNHCLFHVTPDCHAENAIYCTLIKHTNWKIPIHKFINKQNTHCVGGRQKPHKNYIKFAICFICPLYTIFLRFSFIFENRQNKIIMKKKIRKIVVFVSTLCLPLLEIYYFQFHYCFPSFDYFCESYEKLVSGLLNAL